MPSLTLIGRQLQQGKGAGAEGYNGMVDCFRKIVKNEGFSRLYRGITAPILMEAPKRYLFMVSRDTRLRLISRSELPNSRRMTLGGNIIAVSSACQR